MSNRSKEAANDLGQQSHNLRNSIQNLRKMLGGQKSYIEEPLEDSETV